VVCFSPLHLVCNWGHFSTFTYFCLQIMSKKSHFDTSNTYYALALLLLVQGAVKWYYQGKWLKW
jgi:hypothetical protein